MAENSGIEWTDHTFNPWIGCTKVSPACDNCYAETLATGRLGRQWGPHAARRRTKTWGDPVRWNRQAEGATVRPRVFCASLADVFDNHRSILPEWRRDLWALIEATPNLDWLLLTKRPPNIVRFAPPKWIASGFPAHVCVGATVENQTEAERRIPHLLEVPARVLFLSCEPLLGPVDLTEIARPGTDLLGPAIWDSLRGCGGAPGRLNWVITGGESGGTARPSNPQWFRDLRDQCADAGVPFLFKQWGEWVSVSEVEGPGRHHTFEDGRTVRRIGKKRAGRTLDGVIHDGFPAPMEILQ
ncbi:DUF5131 family protein [Sagittula sp.]|uniref:DUF5131 family protein n=1 Tax=Sagittula sp. TaxID=2038081 RepID=UPI0035124DAA